MRPYIIILILASCNSSISSEILYGFNRFNDNINFNGEASIYLKTEYGNFNINQNYSGNATIFNQSANLNDNQSFKLIYDYNVGLINTYYKQRLFYVGDNYSDFSVSSLLNTNQLVGLGYKYSESSYIRAFYGMDNHLQLGQSSIGDVAEIESRLALDIVEWNFLSSFDYKAINRSFDRKENTLNLNGELNNLGKESNIYLSMGYNSLFNNYLRPRLDDDFNIENREQDQIDLSLRFEYQISNALKNSFSISYGIFDRNNSFREFDENNSKTGVIENRENNTYLLSNIINYKLKSGIFSFGIDFFNETFTNNLDDKNLLNESQFNVLLENEKLLDYQNQFTRFKFETNNAINNNIDFRSYGLFEINRMNTPSDKENKDRDLLTTRFGIEGRYNISKFLNYNILIEGRARHLVYLRSEFSADNNWERTLRLRPQINFEISNFRMIPSFEIYVSYRDFDFPDISTNIRSDAQRLIRFQDSLTYRISEKFSFKSSYFYLYKETGKLDWGEFSQSIDEIKQEYFLNSLIYLTRSRFIAGVGLRYYQLDNKSQIELLSGSANLNIESISPETNIIWKISNRTRLEISGWYEFRFNKNSLETIPNLYLQTILNF